MCCAFTNAIYTHSQSIAFFKDAYFVVFSGEVQRRVMDCAALVPGLNDAEAEPDADAASDVSQAPPPVFPPAMNHTPPPPLLCNGIRQEVSI